MQKYVSSVGTRIEKESQQPIQSLSHFHFNDSD